MAPQDKDGFVDPSLVAAWRRMLWLMRGSADVLEALAPTAAGMTKDEISRLLARAGAPSGKGVEPVEQVLGLLGVVPRARYDSLLQEHEALLKEYEELGRRVEEAEQNIEQLRRSLGEQGLVDEAEQLLDSWGGLVRRTLRAQAGFMRSIASGGGTAAGPTLPTAEAPPPQVAEVEREQAPAPPAAAPPNPTPPPPAPRRRPAKTNGTRGDARPETSRRIKTPQPVDSAPPERPAPPARRRAAGTKAGRSAKTPDPAPAERQENDAASSGSAPDRPASRRRPTRTDAGPKATRSGRSSRPH